MPITGNEPACTYKPPDTTKPCDTAAIHICSSATCAIVRGKIRKRHRYANICHMACYCKASQCQYPDFGTPRCHSTSIHTGTFDFSCTVHESL